MDMNQVVVVWQLAHGRWSVHRSHALHYVHFLFTGKTLRPGQDAFPTGALKDGFAWFAKGVTPQDPSTF